jgi:hypothetical protein
MRIEFCTQPFVRSHGREPCFTVRGSWAFEFEDSKEAWFASTFLTLGEAKKEAKAEIKRRAGPDVAPSVTTVVKILP